MVVTRALCDSPSKVVQEVNPVFVFISVIIISSSNTALSVLQK